LQKQITHLKSREPGYLKENLVFHTGTDDLSKNYPILKSELLNSGAALSVTRSNTPITRAGVKIESLDWSGKDKKEKISFDLLTSQSDFVKTNGTILLAGRDIDITKYPADSNSCMINEAAAKIMGFKNPLGQLVKDGTQNWQIVGVLKDFVITSPFQEVEPLFIRGSAEDQVISIRLNNQRSVSENIKLTESILKKYNQNFVTELQFADTDYAQKIKGIHLTSTLTNIFSGIAIFISCLGLFGLVTFTAETKTKEIGIRKVLGAGIINITTLLVKDFVKLVLLSILIATPLAWLLMNAFLRPFYYRVDLSVYILLEAGILTLLITILTTGIQSARVAIKNPANSLRME
jgi:ABC-type antimicrobial peptide transport system permease subunit